MNTEVKKKILEEKIRLHKDKYMAGIPFVWYGAIFEAMEEYALQFKEVKSNDVGDEYIDTIGKCANCGVEFHIHKMNHE